MKPPIALHRHLAAAAIAVAVVATVGLVAEVAQPPEATVDAAAVSPSDASFDQAEYRRHRSLIERRASGFDIAEQARFQRRLDGTGVPAAAEPAGFDLAEWNRHRRLAGG